jgi:predicted anti-sigma-YlaC factor YlaD
VAIAMMTCKDVSALVSTGDLDAAPLGTRLFVRLHLSMCRHCRAFSRQIEALTNAARALAAARDAECPADFEATLADRLRRASSS